jgi:SRSO17 transposase
MEWNARRWRQSIERFKAFMIPLTVPLGRSERRVAAAHYVQGLLMPGQRKSLEPIAARLGVDSQRLQQFMADSPWEETQLWRVIRQEVVPHFEPILGLLSGSRDRRGRWGYVKMRIDRFPIGP